MRLCATFDFPDQPGSAEQRVADDHPSAGQQAERGQPVEPATGIGLVFDLNTLEDRAQRHALRKGGYERAQAERNVP